MKKPGRCRQVVKKVQAGVQAGMAGMRAAGQEAGEGQ